MTVRDNIYKNYQKWWEAYATLKRWLIPWFIEFIEKSHFKKKSALDIWCWNGKYLVYLKNIGFEVSGTDSSETAVEMTKTAIGKWIRYNVQGYVWNGYKARQFWFDYVDSSYPSLKKRRS